jgi:hypothetical protein
MNKNIKIISLEKNADSFINIVPASSILPEWYKESPSFRSKNNDIIKNQTFLSPDNPFVTTSTYKKCTPFLDAMTAGYVFVLSADIEVARQNNGMPYVMWRTERAIVTDHSLDQWEGLPCPQGYSAHLYKWHNQFGIETPKNYSLFFTNPINRFDLPFLGISGIVDTDLYNINVHFPFFIRNDFVGIIKKGTPISQFFPIKRENWQRQYERFDEDKKQIMMDKLVSTIKRSYKNNYWKRKIFK